MGLSVQKALSSKLLGAAGSKDKDKHPIDMATRSGCPGRLYSPDKLTTGAAAGAVIRGCPDVYQIHAGPASRLQTCSTSGSLIRQRRSSGKRGEGEVARRRSMEDCSTPVAARSAPAFAHLRHRPTPSPAGGPPGSGRGGLGLGGRCPSQLSMNQTPLKSRDRGPRSSVHVKESCQRCPESPVLPTKR
jgi:hypothetical protein